MSQRAASAPITIRTNKVAEIDALASAMDRSRNYIVNQAIEQYLEANTGRDEPVEAGASIAPVDKAVKPVGETAPRIDRVAGPADAFARLAAQHDWSV